MNDESRWARLVSEYTGTIHHEISYSVNDFIEDFIECAYFYDEPINHPSSVPLSRLCKESRQYATVLLTGEGADELFGGYPWHRRAWRIDRIRRILPDYVRRTLYKLGPSDVAEKLKFIGLDTHEAVKAGTKYISDNLLRKIIPRYCNQEVCWQEGTISGNNLLQGLLDADMRGYLLPILQRQDRVNMMYGVEARVPFLDYNIVNLSRKLNAEDLFKSGWGKSILRSAVAGLLPLSVIKKKKVGFMLPLDCWMRNCRGMGRLLGWLIDEKGSGRGIWDVTEVKCLINEHLNGEKNNSEILWPLLSLEVWFRLWIDGVDRGEFREEIKSIARATVEVSGKYFEGGQDNTKKNNVCHVVSSMHTGGMEKVIVGLLEKQAESDFPSCLFCIDEEGDLFNKNDAFTKTCAFRKSGMGGLDITALTKLVKFCRANEVRILHAHNMLGMIYSVIAAKTLKIPCVVTVHGHGIYLSVFTRCIRKMLFNKADAVVAVSKSVFDDLVKEDIKNDKVYLIRNGVDSGDIAERERYRQEMRNLLGIGENTFVIGSVGRFRKEKRYDLFIRAFARFRGESKISSDLLLVGDGPEEDLLIKESIKYGIKVIRGMNKGTMGEGEGGRIFLPGLQIDVMKWLYAMDVFCLTSSTEGTSITLLEAGAAGLPAIVTAVGGNEEVVVDGVTGFVVRNTNLEKGFADAFERMGGDAGLRRGMGIKAAERVRNIYGLDRMAEGYFKLYNDVLCKRLGE